MDLSKQQLKFDKQSIIFDVINITFWKEKKLGMCTNHKNDQIYSNLVNANNTSKMGIQVTKTETKNRGLNLKDLK